IRLRPFDPCLTMAGAGCVLGRSGDHSELGEINLEWLPQVGLVIKVRSNHLVGETPRRIELRNEPGGRPEVIISFSSGMRSEVQRQFLAVRYFDDQPLQSLVVQCFTSLVADTNPPDHGLIALELTCKHARRGCRACATDHVAFEEELLVARN